MTLASSEDVLRRAQECADELIGTAKSLHDVATDEEINDQLFCNELDMHIFCCSRCEWWCGQEESHGEGDEDWCDDCDDSDD